MLFQEQLKGYLVWFLILLSLFVFPGCKMLFVECTVGKSILFFCTMTCFSCATTHHQKPDDFTNTSLFDTSQGSISSLTSPMWRNQELSRLRRWILIIQGSFQALITQSSGCLFLCDRIDLGLDLIIQALDLHVAISINRQFGAKCAESLAKRDGSILRDDPLQHRLWFATWIFVG